MLFRRAVSKSNAQDLLVFLGRSPRNWDGVRSQNVKDYQGLSEDEKLAELILSSDKKRLGKPVDFLARAWGVYSVFILRPSLLIA